MSDRPRNEIRLAKSQGLSYFADRFMNAKPPPGILEKVASRRAQAIPTKRAALLFGLKAGIFRWLRRLREFGHAPQAVPQRPLNNCPILAESSSPLYTASASAEWALQAGKVQNLRVAARSLQGRTLAAGETFSFWANVGRATRARGFVRGRELREGCIVPNIGGGLCQLSNSLYEAARLAGFEILERHAHSRPIPESRFRGNDATVFWNYVDLRFRSSVPFQIAVELTADELRVRFLSLAGAVPAANLPSTPRAESISEMAEACETCGIADCFRHGEAIALPQSSGIAWVVDAYQPEFDQWLRTQRTAADTLVLPMDSRRLRVGPYRWNSAGFAAIRSAPVEVLQRSLASRRLTAQGAARQRKLLEMDEALARTFARKIPPLATHLVVSQNLLPFLWRNGILGGRTFDVLMTRLPLAELETVLDAAARRYPESRTLGDFRAPPALIEAEREALAVADRWVTSHSAIAARAGCRALQLDWQLPSTTSHPRGKSVIFPASTLGRKGAYELRAALREFNAPLRLAGPVIESPDFWQGFDVRPIGDHWLTDAAVVVLPAWVEHQPRRLLQAVAAGIPVIASEACGLAGVPGVTVVPEGDSERLREATIQYL